MESLLNSGVVRVVIVLAALFVLPMILLLGSSEKQKNKFLYYFNVVGLRLRNLFTGKTLYCVDYYGGFNICFAVTKEELEEVIPGNHLTPVKMRLIESDKEEYLVSIYCAEIAMNTKDDETQSKDDPLLGRADVFTYVRDQNGELGLVFLSAFVDDSKAPDFVKKLIKISNEFFGMDPTNFTGAYPHYDADTIRITDHELKIQYKNARIHLGGQGDPKDQILATGKKFHPDFVNANSQIYRGPNGAKNTNFFNQSFANADVTDWNPKLVQVENATDIHPLLRKACSFQSYRSPVGRPPIRWYFENN